MQPTLDELPESLDETYERLLKEIKKPNRDHTRRLLQCLVVAIRPLEVEELAEVLAIDFDDGEGIPKLNPTWRWEDEEQALLTSCSSLITIIETRYSRVVQFSHSSVKEFLTSTRLASSIKGISRFHIDLEPAHTVLAQACMGILLRTDDCVEEGSIGRSSSLAGYAAEHWVKHAQFKRVSSFLRKAMENLFDLDKPFFTAWLQIYNIDIRHSPESSSLNFFAVSPASNATPLYYAALCGLQDLVEHLAVKYPHHVNTRGGSYVTPVVAALAGRHFQTVKFLHQHGARLDVRSKRGEAVLHSPAYYGDVEMVKVLLGYKVDVNARREDGWIPLHDAAMYGIRTTRIHDVVQSSREVTRILLEHGSDVNTRNDSGLTPLHCAAQRGGVEIVRFLLEHGADPNARRNDSSTPLHLVAEYKEEVFRSSSESYDVVRVLLRRGAHIAAKDDEGRTPLHIAAQNWRVGLVRLLLEHSAGVNALSNDRSTPLHLLAEYGIGAFRLPDELHEAVRILLERGANVAAKDDKGRTPLHRAAQNGRVELVRLLLEHNADLNATALSNDCSTPLHILAEDGSGAFRFPGDSHEAVNILLDRGANVAAKDDEGRTPLHGAAQSGSVELVRLLLEHGADLNARSNDGSTPLHLFAENGSGAFRSPSDSYEVVHVLLERGANVAAKDDNGRTPLHRAAQSWTVEPVRMLLEHGADPNARTNNNSTPLHSAAANEIDEVLRVLLERGANIGARDDDGRTPLHTAAKNPNVKLVRMLLERNVDVGAKNDKGRTPLHEAAECGLDEVVRMLLKRGVNASAKDYEGRTAFQLASVGGHTATLKLLSEYSAKDVFYMIPTSTSSLCLPW